MTRSLRALRERRQLREDLEELMKDERFVRFFRTFCRQAGVTRSRFSHDPYEIVAKEATRRLAMSYLHLLGQDDPIHLIREIEEETNHTKEYEDER